MKWIAVVVLVAAATGIWWLNRPQPLEVEVQEIGRGLVTQTVSNTRVGTVKACRRAYLAPSSGGEVSSLNVREGAVVKQGDVLLEIWNDNIKAELALQSAQVTAARARVTESCTAAAGARREAERLRSLRSNRLVSEEAADTAATEAEAREASCNGARANLEVALAQVAVTETALERTRVVAPFDGYVAEVNAEIGEYVTPSPPGIPTLPAVDLINADCIYVSAPIDEVDAPAIEVGMPACVSLDAFSDQRCSGFVRRIAPYVMEAEKQARTVEVEVEIRDEAERKGLLPGYSADIEVELDRHENVIRVPSEAILEGNKAYILDTDSGQLQQRTLTIGLANWNFTEIVAGVDEHEKIVMSVGREGVVDGARAVAAPAAK
ncbi:MAG: efflux RND transporter periplasmic adaptor subunit [Gammaproteobacteria bacterium]|nr:efflux RND transporter periplasmic adaptor subunit [Gammaproteobacteria bacterium]